MTRIIANIGRSRFAVILSIVITTAGLFSPGIVYAQALEEIVVTAQRREQSLQEVPIAIDVFTSETLDLQGYRNLDDLAKFSPSVIIRSGVQRQYTAIRGFGSGANSRTALSPTPIFLDGIYFGRTAYIKTGFMDTARVEILKGPQPLFFGLNATAGAFNIVSKRPTPEWEADLSGEYGNNGKNELFGALSGPITDTLGVRVAGIMERNDGYVKSNTDPGKKMGKYDNLGGRLTLEWNPHDNLTVVGKLEASRQRNGGEIQMGCLTDGPASGYSARGGPLVANGVTVDSAIGLFGYGTAALTNPPDGIPYQGSPIQHARVATGQDCFKDEYGFNSDTPFPAKPANVTNEESLSISGGSVAYEQAAAGFWGNMVGTAPEGEYEAFYGYDAGGIESGDHIDALTSLIDVTYTLANDYKLNSLTGMIDFKRYDKRHNSNSPFFQNFQVQVEDAALWSQQLRLESPVYNLDFAGGSTLDYMIGGIVQSMDMDIVGYFPKDSVRRGLRTNVVWEDSDWLSGFWNLNLNFIDDQLSFQVGGRYTKDKRQSFIMGAANQWIFEGRPCDSSLTTNPTQDTNPATCPLDPSFKMVHPELTTYTIRDSVTGRISTPTGAGLPRDVRVDSPIITVPGVNMTNLWTTTNYNVGATLIPLNYRSPIGRAVGYTAPTYNNRENGPYGKCDLCLEDLSSNDNDYDTQVVISLTPNRFDRDHTFYAKYAEAFKGSTTDLAPGPISTVDDVTFLPEYSEAWELGAKGSLMDSRVRYDATLFRNSFKDLQTAAAAPPNTALQNNSVALNAGGQRVKGFEFSFQTAVTDNLKFSVGGALMDGKMTELDGGGCTDDELIAASRDALTPTAQGGSMESRTAAEITAANATFTLLGPLRTALVPPRAEIPEELFINGGCRLLATPDYAAGTINRTGEISSRTPEYGFVAGVDYEHPMFDSYLYFFNMQGFLSDGYITDDLAFSREVKFNKHGDMSLTTGIGNQERSWRLLAYGRNLLEATPSYNPEFDMVHSGVVSTEHSDASNFMQYGVRFEYNFR